jgi:hypothetical protein
LRDNKFKYNKSQILPFPSEKAAKKILLAAKMELIPIVKARVGTFAKPKKMAAASFLLCLLRWMTLVVDFWLDPASLKPFEDEFFIQTGYLPISPAVPVPKI